LQTGIIKIEGITTQQDADKILHALHEVWGVRRAEVNVTNGEATFSYDEKAASYQDFEQAVIDTGFQIGQNGHSANGQR
jgi:copper chaperone